MNKLKFVTVPTHIDPQGNKIKKYVKRVENLTEYEIGVIARVS